MPNLRHVSPDAPRGAQRIVLLVLSSRLNCALERSLPFRLLVWRVVPRIMLRLGGRLPLVPFAAGVIETRDARNGNTHRRAAVYFHDDQDVIVVPSKAGMAQDPHWFSNAVADPDVRFGGDPYRASVVTDQRELDRLWAAGDAYFPAYAAYRRHAARSGRTIPILRLRPTIAEGNHAQQTS